MNIELVHNSIVVIKTNEILVKYGILPIIVGSNFEINQVGTDAPIIFCVAVIPANEINNNLISIS